MKEKYKIGGMTCAACQSHVLKSVEKLSGVSHAAVNLLTGTLELERDPEKIRPYEIVRAVEAGGYTAVIADDAAPRPTRPADENGERRRALILAVCCFIPLFYFAMGEMLGFHQTALLSGTQGAMLNAFIQFLLYLPIIFSFRTIFSRGIRALWHGGANMDTLVSLGAGTGALYSIFIVLQMAHFAGLGDLSAVMQCKKSLCFEASAMVLILVSFGKYLEFRAKRRTGDSIAQLMRLAPQRAVVERAGVEEEIAAAEVQIGDLVILRPGSALPADGTLESGTLTVDQSVLTGESLPVEAETGAFLASGAVTLAGFGKLRVTRAGKDTTLARIIALVEAAGASRAPIARIADKVSGVFVPVVLGCALLTLAVWLICGSSLYPALSAAMAVLLISCPCALGLATPAAIMAGTGRGAEMGILFRNAEALETLHKVDTLLLDKTGTVTAGKPQLTDLITAPGASEEELLRLGASIEACSQHPLAQVWVDYAAAHNTRPLPVTGFSVLPGEGITGKIDGETVSAGNGKMARRILGRKAEIAGSEELFNAGKTVIFVLRGKQLMGCAAFADPVTAEAKEAVAVFHKLKLQCVLLTGDNEGAARTAADALGIAAYRAEVLPADKEALVRSYRDGGHCVAMIGDGVNDAPALARADVGIAIGRGADIALESADVVLMHSDLRRAAAAIRLSRAVIGNIKVNLFWAFFYNILGIPIAAGALYPLWGIGLKPEFGALAMSLSSVCVVTNALRLKNFEKHKIAETHGERDSGSPEPAKTKRIHVEGMMCAHCVARVEAALKPLPEVSAVSVNLADKTATVELSKDLPDETLLECIRKAGYRPEMIG